MHFEAEQIYHIYSRGNNRQQVFFTPDHYLFFLRKIRQHLRPRCEVLAYCLMPNHFHLLVHTTAESCHATATPSSNRQPLTQGLATALSSYTQALNKELNRTGALFQPKAKAQLVVDWHENYPRTCFHYIHQNPVRAGLAAHLPDWPYSSYRDYAGYRSGTLCNQSLAHQLLDIAPEPGLFRQEAERMIPADYIRR